MRLAETTLPGHTVFGFRTERVGPILAAEFETWGQDPDNPMELFEGWLLPMSPGTLRTGIQLPDLYAALRPLVTERGWTMAIDARHRLPWPPNTVVFPDLALHCIAQVDYLPATETVGRPPDLVVELLAKETAERDRAPHGAKFLAYQQSGVREYYYAWPDGSDAAGHTLRDGRFTSLEADAEGFLSSPLLAARLRLVPAAVAA